MADTIIGRVKEAKFYSIICDEGSDASNKKYLLFWLRYVNDDGDICDDFVKFIRCKSDLTGEDLYNEVTEALSSFCLDFRNCRGQGYDGAGAVSGHINRISVLILRDHSKALYTYCAIHRLNLVFGTSRKISSKRNLMGVIKSALPGLREFLATKRPSKMLENAFYFTLKALFILKIFKFLS